MVVRPELRRGPAAAIRANRATAIMVLMIVTLDVFLILVHIYAVIRSSPNQAFYLDADLGYAESFQYVKYVWLLMLVALFSWENRSWQVTMWSPLFAYFLIDDALQIHEQIGKQLAARFQFQDALGLRAADFGELMVSVIAGTVLLIPLVIAYLCSDRQIRRIHRIFAALVVFLLLFGVGLDMLHIIVVDNPGTGDPIGLIEDGGEMLALTLLVAFAMRLNVSGGEPGSF